MKIKLIVFLLLSSLMCVACADQAIDHSLEELKGDFLNKNQILRDSNDSEFKKIPKTSWQYINLENIHKIFMLPSKNKLFLDDGLGDRYVGLFVQRQIRRSVSYPFILIISKEGLTECNYDDNDNNCVVKIQFTEMPEEIIPVRIITKGIRSQIYLYDDEFFDKLQEFEELVISIPLVGNKAFKKMIFDIKGFKRVFLEFDVDEV